MQDRHNSSGETNKQSLITFMQGRGPPSSPQLHRFVGHTGPGSTFKRGSTTKTYGAPFPATTAATTAGDN